MKEDTFVKHFMSVLQPDVHFKQIENLIGNGFPDLLYHRLEIMGMIEAKVEHSGEAFFEFFQLPFMAQMLRTGFYRVFVAVAHDRKDVFSLYHASEFVNAPKTKKQKWTVVKLGDLTPLCKPGDLDMRMKLLTALLK